MRTTASELDFDTSNNVSNISQNDNIHFKLKKLVCVKMFSVKKTPVSKI